VFFHELAGGVLRLMSRARA